ncbi:hypothetical protein ATCVMN08101_277R [Acanthocystis turfacea Chlorella virus MN0810.1]|nr:hypothetical protein ATCVMN08101_277R [Acanthocystis turfacea Chlorella virus MN0810.1]
MERVCKAIIKPCKVIKPREVVEPQDRISPRHIHQRKPPKRSQVFIKRARAPERSKVFPNCPEPVYSSDQYEFEDQGGKSRTSSSPGGGEDAQIQHAL